MGETAREHREQRECYQWNTDNKPQNHDPVGLSQKAFEKKHSFTALLKCLSHQDRKAFSQTLLTYSTRRRYIITVILHKR